MSYKILSEFAQTGGVLYFVALFAGALLYALWPSNRERFDAAARLPLSED